MKASTKTVLYVLGGLATLVGGGTAIYLATRPKEVAKPTVPVIPIMNTLSTIVPTTPVATQADIQQQQLNQQQNQPPPPPPQIQQNPQNLQQFS